MPALAKPTEELIKLERDETHLQRASDAIDAVYLRKRVADLTFHEIPSDSSLREQWLKAISRDDWVPRSNPLVCSLHFRTADFREDCKKRLLKRGTVPSVFDEQISSTEDAEATEAASRDCERARERKREFGAALKYLDEQAGHTRDLEFSSAGPTIKFMEAIQKCAGCNDTLDVKSAVCSLEEMLKTRIVAAPSNSNAQCSSTFSSRQLLPVQQPLHVTPSAFDKALNTAAQGLKEHCLSERPFVSNPDVVSVAMIGGFIARAASLCCSEQNAALLNTGSSLIKTELVKLIVGLRRFVDRVLPQGRSRTSGARIQPSAQSDQLRRCTDTTLPTPPLSPAPAVQSLAPPHGARSKRAAAPTAATTAHGKAEVDDMAALSVTTLVLLCLRDEKLTQAQRRSGLGALQMEQESRPAVTDNTHAFTAFLTSMLKRVNVISLKLMGVSKFYFYDLDMTSDLKLLLSWLQLSGVDITLVLFKLIDDATQVHAQGQMPGLYDCIFRSMSKISTASTLTSTS
ncbi:hypothetical protein HPB52_012697 [Rhipicephalus sanguineus]|uniref:THAP-type domain-containing protein n=1 Tax=Rhipicephalus sanguineus TaxID=34632 RepID=A0A9D4SQQ5_RHISA|nr:hypothetical protein HPB52_012697 [Rhipicephalus sanguineus]